MAQAVPAKWEFMATCDECGAQIACHVIGGNFRREGDNIAYVVTLERLDIEAHLLTHDIVDTP